MKKLIYSALVCGIAVIACKKDETTDTSKSSSATTSTTAGTTSSTTSNSTTSSTSTTSTITVTSGTSSTTTSTTTGNTIICTTVVNSTIDTTVLQNASYTFPDANTIIVTGNISVIDTLKTTSGCDSIITTNITMEIPVTTTVSFKGDIQPILDLNCAIPGCHIGNTGKALGDYSIYTDVKKDADNNLIVNRAIKSSDMPPASSSGPKTISQSDKDLLQKWITEGALDN